VPAPRFKTLALAALSAATIVALSGCDANENADLEKGRQLFTANCGTCHTLKEASSTANVGPDLDAAFAAARASGMDQDTIEGVVQDQIEHPRATDPDDPSYMPPGILEGQEAEDVATYVASVAGVPGIAPPETVGGAGGAIFINNGCGSCHTLAAAETVGTQGPNLDEILPGQSAAQIQESIVAPSAQIEQGYPDIMPQTFEDSIEPADLKTLVKFLMDNAGATGAGGSK
jgi:mono/diheme cytochrome c family protein